MSHKAEAMELSAVCNSEKGNIVFLIFSSVVAALGGLLFGYDTVVIAGTITPVKAKFEVTDIME